MEYNSTLEKKENLLFVIAWIALEGIIGSELSQSQEDKHCMIPLIRCS